MQMIDTHISRVGPIFKGTSWDKLQSFRSRLVLLGSGIGVSPTELTMAMHLASASCKTEVVEQ